jgi:hypothetical protein
MAEGSGSGRRRGQAKARCQSLSPEGSLAPSDVEQDDPAPGAGAAPVASSSPSPSSCPWARRRERIRRRLEVRRVGAAGVQHDARCCQIHAVPDRVLPTRICPRTGHTSLPLDPVWGGRRPGMLVDAQIRPTSASPSSDEGCGRRSFVKSSRGETLGVLWSPTPDAMLPKASSRRADGQRRTPPRRRRATAATVPGVNKVVSWPSSVGSR